VSAVLPLKDSSRELIIEVTRALEPYFPDITAKWREKIAQEFHLDGRIRQLRVEPIYWREVRPIAA